MKNIIIGTAGHIDHGKTTLIRALTGRNTDRWEEEQRRANWKMTAPNLVKCSKCGELMMSHRVCKNCGTYNKKEIVAVED